MPTVRKRQTWHAEQFFPDKKPWPVGVFHFRLSDCDLVPPFCGLPPEGYALGLTVHHTTPTWPSPGETGLSCQVREGDWIVAELFHKQDLPHPRFQAEPMPVKAWNVRRVSPDEFAREYVEVAK